MSKVCLKSILDGCVDIASFYIFCYFKLVVGYFISVDHSVADVLDMLSLGSNISREILMFLFLPRINIAILQGRFGVRFVINLVIIALDLSSKRIINNRLIPPLQTTWQHPSILRWV